MIKTDQRQPVARTGLLQADQRTSPAIRIKIGEQLRTMYGTLEEEPLPDRLLDLTRQLDRPRCQGKP